MDGYCWVEFCRNKPHTLFRRFPLVRVGTAFYAIMEPYKWSKEMKDAKRLSLKMKVAWKEEFVSNIRRNPQIKDPAYVEWLAAFSFTVLKENVKVATLAEKIGISRTYVYPMLKGKNAARQDVMEQVASVLSGLPLAAFREYGRELLGGPEKAAEVLKDIIIERFITGYTPVGVNVEIRRNACFLPRGRYSRDWGPLTKLTVFEVDNNWAVVDLNRKKAKEAKGVLVVEDGKLEVCEVMKASPAAELLGVVLYWVVK